MMADNFNYGPPLNFEKLHQLHEHHSNRSSYSLLSSFGAHWKKVESGMDKQSDCSALTPIPSRKTNISSLSHLSYPNTISASMHSFSEKGTSSDKPKTILNCKENQTSFLDNANIREITQCLNVVQMKGLTALDQMLERSVREFTGAFQKQKSEFVSIVREEKEKHGKEISRLVDDVDGIVDSAAEYYESRTAQFGDTVNQVLNNFYEKNKIESFVRDYEDFYDLGKKMSEIILENRERVARVRHNLKLSMIGSIPSKLVEENNNRVQEVYDSLIKLVYSLPLDDDERALIKYEIQKIEENQALKKNEKCEKIVHKLFATMNKWEKNSKSMSSIDSDDWKSVGSIDGMSSVLESNKIDSSSFALTDSTIDDSNLNNLEEELRSARIRKAVEGSTQLNESSIHEPIGFSSSEAYSEIQESASLHDSHGLMTNQTAEKESDGLKTAYSVTGSISPRSLRSMNKISNEPNSGSITTLESTSFGSFSHASLNDIVEEILHTAKEDFSVSSIQPVKSFEGLRKSASKSEADLTNLITAISTSSESLSDTQSTHHSYSTIH